VGKARKAVEVGKAVEKEEMAARVRKAAEVREPKLTNNSLIATTALSEDKQFFVA
jgi:hypothetical protein